MLGLIIHLVHYLFIDFKHSWWLLLIFSSDRIIYWNLSVCFCTSSIFPVMQSCHIWYLLYKLSVQLNSERYIFLIFFIYLSLLSVDISSLISRMCVGSCTMSMLLCWCQHYVCKYVSGSLGQKIHRKCKQQNKSQHW